MKQRILLMGLIFIGLGGLAMAGVPNRIVYQGRLSKSGAAVSGIFNLMPLDMGLLYRNDGAGENNAA